MARPTTICSDYLPSTNRFVTGFKGSGNPLILFSLCALLGLCGEFRCKIGVVDFADICENIGRFLL